MDKSGGSCAGLVSLGAGARGHNGSLCFSATICRNTHGGGDALARPASELACCNGLRCGEITHALASRRVR